MYFFTQASTFRIGISNAGNDAQVVGRPKRSRHMISGTDTGQINQVSQEFVNHEMSHVS